MILMIMILLQYSLLSAPGPRPVSGAFTLDLEKIEAVANDMVPDSGPEVRPLPPPLIRSLLVMVKYGRV
jgi:hypothetical protein